MLKFKSLLLAVTLCMAGVALSQEPAPAPEEGAPVNKPAAAAGNPERVVARVGDLVITEREYQKSLAMRWVAEAGPNARTTPPNANFRAAVMREMVDARILRILAQNSGVEVTEEEVRKEFDEGKSRLPSEEAFAAYLERLGMTQDSLMKEIRDRLLVDKFSDQETAGATVPEEKKREFYEELKKNGKHMRNSPTADVLQILVIPDSDSEQASEQARARAEAARQRVLDGESFEEVAKDVSQDVVSGRRGGLYREAVPGLVGPEVSQKMMELPIGEVSEPFKSVVGWHVIKVLARYEPGEMSYEHMEGVIGERLLEAERRRLLAERINEARSLIRVEFTPSDKE